MYIFLWLAVGSSLRFLPSCTAIPIDPITNANTPATQQTASYNCSNPSTAGITATCWTTLEMDDFFTNWTTNTIMANPPMIGTLYCRPREVWASCFLRFAYGEQRLPIASTDCSTITSTTCKSPANSLMATPTSPQFYYGAYAIFATYITTLASALLFTTAKPGALQSAYTSANANAGAAAAPNPVDATLFQLLFLNGLSDHDILFSAYMKQNPFSGNFTVAAAMATPATPAISAAVNATAAATTTETPSDAVIYRALVAVLNLRLGQVMGSWRAFEQVLAGGSVWMAEVQGKADFVRKWTADGAVAAATTS
ncbi:MAG: hypothetical protein Q9208_000642 [Pyrenodesmia sp. 3 TL-2023]